MYIILLDDPEFHVRFPSHFVSVAWVYAIHAVTTCDAIILYAASHIVTEVDVKLIKIVGGV